MSCHPPSTNPTKCLLRFQIGSHGPQPSELSVLLYNTYINNFVPDIMTVNEAHLLFNKMKILR